MRALTIGLLLTVSGACNTLRAEPPAVQGGEPPKFEPVPAAPAFEPVPAAPANGKARVDIIVINGLDPLFLGKLNDFCKKVEAAGYSNVNLFPLRGGSAAERKILAIRQEDPKAKIVIAGYSWGANEARTLCHGLKEKDVRIDLLVYMAADMVGNRAYSRPENCGRVVNINAHGLLVLGGDLVWNGADIDNANNYRLDCRHLGLPRQNQALEIFLREVATACGE